MHERALSMNRKHLPTSSEFTAVISDLSGRRLPTRVRTRHGGPVKAATLVLVGAIGVGRPLSATDAAEMIRVFVREEFDLRVPSSLEAAVSLRRAISEGLESGGCIATSKPADASETIVARVEFQRQICKRSVRWSGGAPRSSDDDERVDCLLRALPADLKELAINACTEVKQAIATKRLEAIQLENAALARQKAELEKSASAAAAAPASPLENPFPGGDTEADGASPRRHGWILPSLILGGGGVLAAGGVAWWRMDGECADDSCAQRYGTKTRGIVATALGAGAILTGGWMLLDSARGDGSAKVSIGPGTLTVSGRF